MRTAVVIALLISGSSAGYAQTTTNVYAGGINQIESMLKPGNSRGFRRSDGGLHIHNSGWGELSGYQRRKLLEIYDESSISIEIGFAHRDSVEHPDTWFSNARDIYKAYGIKPQLVLSTCFAEKHVPTAEEWRGFHTKYTQIMAGTKLLPVFEYPNFHKGSHLLAHTIDKDSNFERITATSGGLAIDAPPYVFLSRENAYREWVISAIKYCNARKYISVLIISPDHSGKQFRPHVLNMLNTLGSADALPSVYVVENYIYDKWWRKQYGVDYPNKIGSENQVNSILGIAKLIKTKVSN